MRQIIENDKNYRKIMKTNKVVLHHFNLWNRILSAFAAAKATIKHKNQLRLCIMIRLDWGHVHTYERNMKNEDFKTSQISKLCQIFGISKEELENPDFPLDCRLWNLAIPEWLERFELP